MAGLADAHDACQPAQSMLILLALLFGIVLRAGLADAHDAR